MRILLRVLWALLRKRIALHYDRQRELARAERRGRASAIGPKHRVAVMVSSRNGEATIGDTVRSAIGQADVYVVSDGSSDRTAEVAMEAGATVLALPTNIGKPNALYRLKEEYGLTSKYEAIAILDDDTRLDRDFMKEALKVMFPDRPPRRKPGIVVGRTNTIINRSNRWNVWLLFRAYAHWRYQVTYRMGQSVLNAMNCISGSNSVYTPAVIDRVLIENPPYAVDDTWWTLEVKRHEAELGRIVYAHKAVAWICDPLTMRAWYKQSLRWMWGMMQGIRGHKVGRRLSWFDFTYVLNMLDWALYVFTPTASLGLAAWLIYVCVAGADTSSLVFWGMHFSLAKLAIWYFVGVYLFAVLSVIGTGYWRILMVVPVFLPMDFLFRVVLLHALIKTIRQPTVSTNVWESPGRYELEGGV